jgi:hypothetical protein
MKPANTQHTPFLSLLRGEGHHNLHSVPGGPAPYPRATTRIPPRRLPSPRTLNTGPSHAEGGEDLTKPRFSLSCEAKGVYLL